MENMNEVTFLLKLAITVFNRQYNTNFNIDDFCIFSIEPSYGFDLGYEIVTIINTDNVRLRIYLNIGEKDNLSNYKLEVNHPSYTGGLGDEVHVALGEIDKDHIENNLIKFLFINTCNINNNVIATEDDIAITTEDGEVLIIETAVI